MNARHTVDFYQTCTRSTVLERPGRIRFSSLLQRIVLTDEVVE
jgi:hypothetical protein